MHAFSPTDFCEVKVATGGDSSTKQESIISSNDIIDLTCDSGENAGKNNML